MLDGTLLDDEALAMIGGVSNVDEVKFSPECTTQAKPAVLVVTPQYPIKEDELETLGIRLTEILTEYLEDRQTPVKASVEYPVGISEDGTPQTDSESPLLKFRWRQITNGVLSETRLNGYPIRDGLPEN